MKTFGCSLNSSDSEVISGLLKDTFTIVDDEDSADLVIVNTCVVKEKTVSHLWSYLDSLKAKQKKIIVAGCGPQSMPERFAEYSMIGTSQISNILMVVEETLAGNTVALIAIEDNKRLLLPKVRKNPMIGIVPISKGCLGACSFCLTKKARGNLESYPIRDIMREVELAIHDGCKEIWLTSQDTACYGMDIKSSLPELLSKLIEIPGDFKIRLGMGNPEWFAKHTDKLISIFKSQKLFKFLHIPIQSGNDDILKAMRRPYTVADFLAVVEPMRKAHPDLTISTDIIVAFPGETKEQFNDSLKIVEKVQFDVVNISRFSAHEGIPASDYPDQIVTNEAKERSVFMTQRAEWSSFERNKKWLNWEGDILIDEPGTAEDSWVGRNYAYKPIVVQGKFKLGDKLRIRIDNLTSHALRGKVQRM